mmetsp:Transcript_62519/g.146736  ORF Transcript_62519/g.146736 Transcript_62519/m.146736 type:complete len:265 (+) Transcript_62519:93-887(+)
MVLASLLLFGFLWCRLLLLRIGHRLGFGCSPFSPQPVHDIVERQWERKNQEEQRWTALGPVVVFDSNFGLRSHEVPKLVRLLSHLGCGVFAVCVVRPFFWHLRWPFASRHGRHDLLHQIERKFRRLTSFCSLANAHVYHAKELQLCSLFRRQIVGHQTLEAVHDLSGEAQEFRCQGKASGRPGCIGIFELLARPVKLLICLIQVQLLLLQLLRQLLQLLLNECPHVLLAFFHRSLEFVETILKLLRNTTFASIALGCHLQPTRC